MTRVDCVYIYNVKDIGTFYLRYTMDKLYLASTIYRDFCTTALCILHYQLVA